MADRYPMADGQERHVLPISLWRRVGDTVYFAGAGAVDERGEFVGDTFEAQMRYTMAQFGRTIEDAGMTIADIVQVRAYVQYPTDIPLYNQIYREFFAEPFPVRTTTVNCLPPGLLFEIDAIAFVPSSGQK